MNMMMKTTIAAAVLVSSLYTTAAQAQVAGDGSKPLSDKYIILTQRSMFSRTRTANSFGNNNNNGNRINSGRNVSGFGGTSQVRESVPVFIGAMNDESEYTAFLEDPRSGKSMTARVGQVMPQGKITEISLDYLMVQPADGGEAKRIDMGKTLTGEARPAVSGFGSSGFGASSSGFGNTGGSTGFSGLGGNTGNRGFGGLRGANNTLPNTTSTPANGVVVGAPGGNPDDNAAPDNGDNPPDITGSVAPMGGMSAPAPAPTGGDPLAAMRAKRQAELQKK